MMISNQELMRVRDDAVAAVQDQKPGVMFVGAFGEAEKAGYRKDSIAYNIFVTIFVGGLGNVWVNKETGLIDRVEPK